MERKDRPRIIFCHGEGIGNMVQAIPAIRTISEEYIVDYWHAFSTYTIPNLIPYIDNFYAGSEIRKLNPETCSGKVTSTWTYHLLDQPPLSHLRLLNNPTLSPDRPEIDSYLDIARELGISPSHYHDFGTCLYRDVDIYYDVVMSNGFNRFGGADWSVKSYPYLSQVANFLRNKLNLSVCSVGLADDLVDGTDNYTGIGLLESLGVIKNSMLFIGNDSGFYHCANALGIPNIVIFTATSPVKNYYRKFHRHSALIMRGDLSCRPCQKDRGWRSCREWTCREIAPEIIIDYVKEML